jgi:hypothetical protein
MNSFSQTSPDCMIRVDFVESEQRGIETGTALWVYTPSVINLQTGEILVDLTGESLWDATAAFEGHEVVLTLRKFPGNKPACSVRIDPIRKIFVFADIPDRPQPLSELQEALDRRQRASDYGPKVGFPRRRS